MSQFNLKTISNLLIIFSFFFITLSCKKDSRDDILESNCNTESIQTQVTTLLAAFNANPSEASCNSFKDYLETTITNCASNLPQNIISIINTELDKLDCSELVVDPACNPETIEAEFSSLLLAFVGNQNVTNCNKLKTFIESTIANCFADLPEGLKNEISNNLAALDCTIF
jgi:hypothetical protein